jgi:hypothetical protein
VVDWFSAGCPGPHAWRIGNLGYDLPGAPCAVDAGPPFNYRVTVTIEDDPALSEGTVLAKASSSTLAPVLGIVELGASRTLQFDGTGDQYVSFAVDVLIDRDGDGLCTEGIDEDFGTVDRETRIDLETFEVSTTRYLNRVSAPCERWR